MSLFALPILASILHWARVVAKSLALATVLLVGWAAQAQPSGGYWKLKGAPIFHGRDGGSNGWVWKIDGHSPGNIAVTNSIGGDTTISVRAEWDAPPKVLRVGEIPPFRLGAAFQSVINPRGFGIPAEVSCSFKHPSGITDHSWAIAVPMEAGKQVRGTNTTMKVPGGGESISLIYGLFFATSYNLEFVYEWVNGSPANGSLDITPSPNSAWLQGDPAPVKKVKSAA